MPLRRPFGPPAPFRPIEVLIDIGLLAEAEILGVDVSKACQAGLAAALKRVREDRWREENAEAIESYNAWVAKNGLPLEKYRLF